MAATTETVTADDIGYRVVAGAWTSDSTKGDHVITLPVNVAWVVAVLDSGGTNPNILMKSADESDESILVTGSTGVITSPADSAGIAITNATGGSGTTVDIDSTSQVNSGTNQWFALVKP